MLTLKQHGFIHMRQGRSKDLFPDLIIRLSIIPLLDWNTSIVHKYMFLLCNLNTEFYQWVACVLVYGWLVSHEKMLLAYMILRGYRIVAWELGIPEDNDEEATPLWRRDYFLRLRMSPSTSHPLLPGINQPNSSFSNTLVMVAFLPFHNYN